MIPLTITTCGNISIRLLSVKDDSNLFSGKPAPGQDGDAPVFENCSTHISFAKGKGHRERTLVHFILYIFQLGVLELCRR